MAYKTPVLFLVFNRPDTTAQVFAQIRAVKPKYLYVAADGPRMHKEGEAECCKQVREIATAIDWDCELRTLFREQNLGCGKAVSEAITWFFEQVEQGVILEDDCLPDISFFRFAEELLIKYKYDREIMTISGSNLLGSWKPEKQSYFFGQGGVWGWATWRRSWQLYNKDIEGWNLPSNREIIKKGLVTDGWYAFYEPMMEAAFNNSLDTWDAQWLYCILLNRGLSINPAFNLVKNLGFNENATHTKQENKYIVDLALLNLSFPLRHPKVFETDKEFLRRMYEAMFDKSRSSSKLNSNLFRSAIWKIKCIFNLNR